MWGFLGKVLKGIGSFLFGSAKKVVEKAPEVIGSAAGTAIGSGVGSAISKPIVDKITGVPTPQDAVKDTKLSGVEQGVQSRDYYDTAFPGTTPWERLGTSSPMGVIASSLISSKSAQFMQDRQNKFENNMKLRELVTQMEIAKQNNRVQAMGYGSPMGVEGARKMLDVFEGKDVSETEKTKADIQREKYGSMTSAGKSIYDSASGMIDKMLDYGIMRRKVLKDNIRYKKEYDEMNKRKNMKKRVRVEMVN